MKIFIAFLLCALLSTSCATLPRDLPTPGAVEIYWTDAIEWAARVGEVAVSIYRSLLSLENPPS